MIETFEPKSSTLSRLEIDSKLRSKFLAVTLQKEKYCFRIMAVKEIIEGIEDLIADDELYDGEIFCLLKYKGETVPVFDFRELNEQVYLNSAYKFYTLICDVIGNGLLFKIGILVADINVVFNALINEINEDIIFERIN